jgi:hypothetical protein
MAKNDEVGSDWTEPVMTRISTKAKKLLDEKLSPLQGVSHASYMRRLIYKDLGLLKEND